MNVAASWDDTLDSSFDSRLYDIDVRFSRPYQVDRIVLSIDGRDSTWQVVGLVRELGPPTAYVNYDYFTGITGTRGSARDVRVATEVTMKRRSLPYPGCWSRGWQRRGWT